MLIMLSAVMLSVLIHTTQMPECQKCAVTFGQTILARVTIGISKKVAKLPLTFPPKSLAAKKKVFLLHQEN
jgi:hypothetical protein